MLTLDVVDPTELGQRLRALRLEHEDWYVTDAAARLGLSHGEYSRLERGEGIVEWLAERPDVGRELGL